MGLVTLFRIRSFMHSRRLLRAEQQFFDSYGRGGINARRPLVIPLDFFVSPDIQVMLSRWLGGAAPLDVAALEATFRARAPDAPLSTFHENMLVFLALLTVPLRNTPDRPTLWRVPQKKRLPQWASSLPAHGMVAAPPPLPPPQP